MDAFAAIYSLFAVLGWPEQAQKILHNLLIKPDGWELKLCQDNRELSLLAFSP